MFQLPSLNRSQTKKKLQTTKIRKQHTTTIEVS